MFADRILTDNISLERVSALVGNNIGVAAGSVEVCEDKRRLVIRDIGHVTAGRLCFAPDNIEKLVIAHEIHELCGLGRKLVIHLSSGFQNLLRSADGCGISLSEVHTLVIVHQVIQPEALSSSLVELFRERNKILLHLLPELRDIASVIAVAHHSRVAERQIVLVPHGLALMRAVLHEPVIQIVQLFLIFRKERRKGLVRFLADRAVTAVQIRPHQ